MGSRVTRLGADEVYEAAELWVERALRQDDSLFTQGEAIWSLPNLCEVHQRFLDEPNTSKMNFFEKLEKRLANSPPEVYQLMAETLFFHYIMAVKRSVPPTKKAYYIDIMLKRSGRPVSIPSNLNQSLMDGLAAPGSGFNTNKIFYLGFIIKVAIAWKQQSREAHEQLLHDPEAFKDFLYSVKTPEKLFAGRKAPTAANARLSCTWCSLTISSRLWPFSINMG